MFYRRNVSALSRLKTSELIALRAEYTRNASIYRSIKLGFMGLIGILFANLAKIVLETQAYDVSDKYSVLVLAVSLIIFVYFNVKEASSMVTAGIIHDLLSIRLSKTSTGKKKAK